MGGAAVPSGLWLQNVLLVVSEETRVFPGVHVSSWVWLRLGKVSPGTSCSPCAPSCTAGVNDNQAGSGGPHTA